MSLADVLLDWSRQLPAFEFPVTDTDAARRAAHCFEINRIALEATCPLAARVLPDALPELEWLFARDGSLSARHIDGEWIGGVSVPARAAAKMLATLEVPAATAVLLAPSHAQQIARVLDKLEPHQALVTVLPDEHEAAAMLACADFANPLRGGRLLLVIGPDWKRQLAALLESRSGVTPATTMIRLPGVNDDLVEAMLRPCEKQLGAHAAEHRRRLATPREVSVGGTPRLAVVVGGWRMWRDERPMLLRAAESAGAAACDLIDTARPDRASALSIAERAAGCDALLTAHFGRSELPNIVPRDAAWLTLVTTGRPPASAARGPRDRLIVADASMRDAALAAGWPADRVDALGSVAVAPPAGRPAIFFDLPSVEMPASIRDMSSHAIVWEQIARELGDSSRVPIAAPAAWIGQIADSIGVGEPPVALLRERIVWPTLARTIVRRLRARGVEFDLYGRGWDAIDPAAVPIEDEAAFAAALDRASCVIDLWPEHPTHAVHRCGRPTVAAWGLDDRQLIDRLRAARLERALRPTLPLDAILRVARAA